MRHDLLFNFNRRFNAGSLQSGFNITFNSFDHMACGVTQFDFDRLGSLINFDHTSRHVIDSHPRVDHGL